MPDILARFEQLYGTLDEETTTVRLTYAQTLYATRHLVGACDEYHRVIAAYQQQSHQDPMKFLVVRSEYSRCLLELGRFEETLTELSTIVEQARQVYGDDDEETFKAWNNYAWGLYKAGMISEAQFEYECLLDATVQKLGPTHPIILGIHETLSDIATQLG